MSSCNKRYFEINSSAILFYEPPVTLTHREAAEKQSGSFETRFLKKKLCPIFTAQSIKCLSLVFTLQVNAHKDKITVIVVCSAHD